MSLTSYRAAPPRSLFPNANVTYNGTPAAAQALLFCAQRSAFRWLLNAAPPRDDVDRRGFFSGAWLNHRS